jgi:hypothetical protein
MRIHAPYTDHHTYKQGTVLVVDMRSADGTQRYTLPLYRCKPVLEVRSQAIYASARVRIYVEVPQRFVYIHTHAYIYTRTYISCTFRWPRAFFSRTMNVA